MENICDNWIIDRQILKKEIDREELSDNIKKQGKMDMFYFEISFMLSRINYLRVYQTQLAS